MKISANIFSQTIYESIFSLLISLLDRIKSTIDDAPTTPAIRSSIKTAVKKGKISAIKKVRAIIGEPSV